jgi:Mn2+/Fe2+ NRAMP family transporter
MDSAETASKPRNGRPPLAELIGPGLIAGAADDDPSGIATYSQAGAQYGPHAAWSLVLAFPFMAGIQEISARIGRVTGKGIGGNLARHYPAWLARVLILLMVVANTCNLGADLGAMGAALAMLIGGPEKLYVVGFAVLSAVLQVFLCYTSYARFLKWLTLSLLAYVGAACLAHIHWGEAALALVWPHIEFSAKYATLIVAVLGTTISPYLFFWQAGLEVEQQQAVAANQPLCDAPQNARRELNRIRWDTVVGMGLSTFIGLCILITTSGTLNAHGITDIRSAGQAAEALRPIAGKFAFILFAAGIIGTGMLALPSLSGSAAYAVGEALKLPVGLDRKAREAPTFYGVMVLCTLIGGALNFVGIDPMDALVWSAVLNGAAAAPIMALLVHMASDHTVMGKFPISRRLAWIGWGGTALMAVATVVMLVTL